MQGNLTHQTIQFVKTACTHHMMWIESKKEKTYVHNIEMLIVYCPAAFALLAPR